MAGRDLAAIVQFDLSLLFFVLFFIDKYEQYGDRILKVGFLFRVSFLFFFFHFLSHGCISFLFFLYFPGFCEKISLSFLFLSHLVFNKDSNKACLLLLFEMVLMV